MFKLHVLLLLIKNSEIVKYNLHECFQETKKPLINLQTDEGHVTTP